MTDTPIDAATESTPAADGASAPLPDAGQALRILEALLFASAEPLDDKALSERLPEGSDVPALVAQLEEIYRHRGVNLVRVAGRYTFRTASDLAGVLAIEKQVPRKLSRAAVETLATIAYHQPVTRPEIEEIRGVQISRGTIEVLMEAGWIQPKGHRETPGRPATWVTTEKFLSHFGLDSLEDLPGVEELRAAGLLDARPAVTSYGDEGGLTPRDDAESGDEETDSGAPLLEPEAGGPPAPAPPEAGARGAGEP